MTPNLEVVKEDSTLYLDLPSPWRVHLLQSTDSTNRYILDQMRLGAGEGLVAIAEVQTAGKGRMARKWFAPPGASLLVSVLTEPRLSAADLHFLTKIAAMALQEAIEEIYGLVSQLKWPNDLLIEEKKLAGILAESVIHQERAKVVLGAGVNLDWTADAIATVERPATAISLELGRAAGRRHELAMAYLRHLAVLLCNIASAQGRARLLFQYKELCVTLGRNVRVETTAGVVEGQAVDITANGEIVVQVGERRQTFSAGDVVHLRSAT